jgi:hypothetical protein
MANYPIPQATLNHRGDKFMECMKDFGENYIKAHFTALIMIGGV